MSVYYQYATPPKLHPIFNPIDFQALPTALSTSSYNDLTSNLQTLLSNINVLIAYFSPIGTNYNGFSVPNFDTIAAGGLNLTSNSITLSKINPSGNTYFVSTYTTTTLNAGGSGSSQINLTYTTSPATIPTGFISLTYIGSFVTNYSTSTKNNFDMGIENMVIVTNTVYLNILCYSTLSNYFGITTQNPQYIIIK